MSDETTQEPPEEPQQQEEEAHSFEEGKVLPEPDEPGSDDRMSQETHDRIEQEVKDREAAQEE